MAGIIKASQRVGKQRGTQLATFNFDDINVKADEYLGEVRAKASRIIASATDQAEQVRQLAAQRGKDEARAVAEQTVLKRLEERLQTLVPALERTIEAIQREKDGWFKEWESNAVHLAVAIAARVIRREVSNRPEITLDLIREALEMASSGEQIRLHLNPRDFETLGEQAGELSRRISSLAPTDIVADPTVSPGGCIIKTEYGEIDQQFESQLARIEEEMA